MATKGSNGAGVWRKVDYSRKSLPRWDITNGDEAIELFYEFKAFGEIMEFVIPPKKDKYGRRYGFVRFVNVPDVKSLEIKLDNMFLDGRKLHVNLTRFNRPVLMQIFSYQKERRVFKGEPAGEKRGY
ncbi:uncharacterized protein LOC131614792 [Vicia villosa]|uniref:uncharacterized protein LOC131614792 n=1 Tax=Vicia villosa TaxID=3911 RepID=UPI00273AF36D|nr:uncharacterized protein LOC131614792 [Vicia villosa]